MPSSVPSNAPGNVPIPGPGSAVLVASNRGPISFIREEDGTLTMRRGGGGLVSGLVSAARSRDAVWVCAALSDVERGVAQNAPRGRLDEAGHDTGELAVRMLAIEAGTFDRAYNVIANSTLWFIHHMLYDSAVKPWFDTSFRKAWISYRAYNRTFADALAAEAAEGAKVIVQDYHLSLAPAMLRAKRPDLSIGHFSHTPWAPPDYYRMLPDDVAAEVLTGILGADGAGFLTRRWAEAFADCCEAVLGACAERDGSGGLSVTYAGRTTRITVHPLGVDGGELIGRASHLDVLNWRDALREMIGDRKVLLRIDRTELSKNIVRGLAAYREFLRRYPEWHERVVHVAFAYPSRHDLPEYREYTAAVQRIAREIENEFGTPGWRPLQLAVDDDFPRSLAAYRMADVLLVNPVRDGMNLVAKECPVLSDHGTAMVLSREAGAAEELGADAILINPYDITGTATALHEALTMPERERLDRCRRLAAAATALPPPQWFADQLAALD